MSFLTRQASHILRSTNRLQIGSSVGLRSPGFGTTSSTSATCNIDKTKSKAETGAGKDTRVLDRGKGSVPRQMSGPQRSMIEKTQTQTTQKAGGSGVGGGSGSAASAPDSWSAQQRAMTDRIFHSPVAKTEAEIRQDLRTAHRLIARLGLDDLVWNHVSARCSADQTEDCCDLPLDTYLITPGGMHFSEVRNEDFVFDSIEDSGNIIHSGIYQKRPDVRCIIHTHSMPIMTVSVLKGGFKFLTQDSAPFYKKIGYHDWEGLSTSDVERDRIASNLGEKGVVLFMRNHGATVVGRSVQEAWVNLYYLDRCCRVQLEAMKTGGELVECCAELLEHAAEQIEQYFPHGKYEWRALSRLVD